MTLQGTDLIAIASLIAAGFAGCYALSLRKLRTTLTDRQMKIADQIAALDEAIHVLEQRLADQRSQLFLEKPQSLAQPETRHEIERASSTEEEESEVSPEVKAAIAAAAIAAVGPDAVVHSVKPVTSPWTQQGRVLVQGGHNLRVQR